MRNFLCTIQHAFVTGRICPFFCPHLKKVVTKSGESPPEYLIYFSEENKFLFQKAPAVSTVENLYLKEKKRGRKELRKRIEEGEWDLYGPKRR